MRILPANWNPVTEAFIASALTTASLDDIRAQVANGAQIFKVWDVYMNTVCAFVLRVDHMAHESQGVVVAAGGRADIDLTANVLPAIEKMFTGCARIRIHTERPGLVRKLTRQGYGGVEFVAIKDLSHGR